MLTVRGKGVVVLVRRLFGIAVPAAALLALLAMAIGPRTGAYQVRTVLTGSMRPTIPEGSVVVVTPVRLSELRVDDVITYRIPAEDRRIVTHRIVEIKVAGEHPVVRTKGDANRDVDPWDAHLRGDRAWRASLSIPKLGYALETLRWPVLRMVTVLVAPALLALVSLVQIWSPKDPGRSQDKRPARPAALAPVGPVLSQQERLQQWREHRGQQRPIPWKQDA